MIEEGWKIIRLNEITSKIGDGLHGTPIYDDMGEYYFINGSNLVSGKIELKSNTKRVSETEFKKHKKELSEKTILIGINGTIGNVALYNNEKCILGKSAAYLNVNENFDKEFLKYIFLNDHFQKYIRTNATGTTIKNVGLALLREYEFQAPVNKDEQSRIASILSSLDDKIELNLQMNKTLEAIAQAIFKEWFVDFRFPGFDGELVDGLPKGWKEVPVTDVVDTISLTYKFVNDKVVFLNTSDILNGEVLNQIPTNSKTLPGQAKKSIQKDDILFSEIRPANRRFAYIDFEASNYVVSTKLMVLRSKGTIDPLVIYYFFKRDEILNELQALAESRSGTFPQITYTVLGKLNMVIPDDNTNKIYTSFLRSIFKTLRNNQCENQTLIQLRNTLLPRLMTGKIKVA